MTPKRLALRVLLVSVAIASLFGIFGILADGLERTALHVWLTSIAVSAASLLALAQISAWELPQARAISRGGLAMTTISLAVWIAAIWIEPRADDFWKVAGSLLLCAVASAHACVLWLARLPPRATALRTAALACDVLIVVLMLAAMWSEFHDDGAGQVLAILCVIESGLTVAAIAIAAAARATPLAGDVSEVCFCVRCGKTLWVPAGDVRCRHCDATFFVELREVEELPGAVLRS